MPTLPDTLDELTARAKRAKQHIADLDAACQAFFNTRPYEITTKFDMEARQHTTYVTKVPIIPIRIATIIADILTNLRGTLDHLAWYIYTISGRIGRERDICFPIAETLAVYESTKKRIVKGWCDEAVAALDSFKPYKGGNNLLWSLHELYRLNQHRLLARLGTTCTAQSAFPSQRDELIKDFLASNPGHPIPETLLGRPIVAVPVRHILQSGDVLRAVATPEFDKHLRFHFDIAFRDPETVQCETVVETMNEMANLVLAIVLDFSSKGLLDCAFYLAPT